MSKSPGVFEDRHVHLSFKRRVEASHGRMPKVPEDHARIAIKARLCVTRMPRPEIFLKATRSASTATSAAGTNRFDLTREFERPSTDRRPAAYERPLNRRDSIRGRPLLVARGCCPWARLSNKSPYPGTVRRRSLLCR